MFVVIINEDGYDCFGPFGTEEAANIWAEKRFGDDEDSPDWDVVALQPSEED